MGIKQIHMMCNKNETLSLLYAKILAKAKYTAVLSQNTLYLLTSYLLALSSIVVSSVNSRVAESVT